MPALEEANIENVVLYVDDALRYDYAPSELRNHGAMYRTVAASTHTPTSFGSILTGLLPPASGILSFKHTKPADIRSIFDVEEVSTTIEAAGGMNETIANIFSSSERVGWEDVEPPFIHVIRRPGGHAPYDGFGGRGAYYREEESAREYQERLADDPDQKRRDYQEGIRSAYDAFETLLETYKHRGLLDTTLVVYTSDHGEMLGEYGVFGHTHLAVPEVVYTPTVFVHPDIKSGERDGILHHVDLLSTIAQSMDREIDVGQTHGMPFGADREYGCNYFEHHNYASLSLFDPLIDRTENRTIRSIWDADGGHTFTTGSWTQILLLGVGLSTIATASPQLWASRGYRPFYEKFLPGHSVYGTPSLGRDEAGDTVGERLHGDASTFERELSTDMEEHLKDMGYM